MTLKHIAVILSLGIMFYVSGPGNSWAGVSISPAFVEVNLDQKRASGQFLIRNTGNETERYRIVSSHFIFGKKGEFKKITPDENSLVPWLKFNPKEFSLPPKSRRAVRYVIVPKGKIVAKEYWGFMELQSLRANVTSAKDKAGRSMKLKIIPSILVPIFASRGKLSYGATLGVTNIAPLQKGFKLESLVTNTGTGHLLLKGHYEIANSSGSIVKEGKLGKTYILPGGLRSFNKVINDRIPKGNYTVTVAYSDPNLEQTITSKTEYTW